MVTSDLIAALILLSRGQEDKFGTDNDVTDETDSRWVTR